MVRIVGSTTNKTAIRNANHLKNKSKKKDLYHNLLNQKLKTRTHRILRWWEGREGNVEQIRITIRIRNAYFIAHGKQLSHSALQTTRKIVLKQISLRIIKKGKKPKQPTPKLNKIKHQVEKLFLAPAFKRTSSYHSKETCILLCLPNLLYTYSKQNSKSSN